MGSDPDIPIDYSDTFTITKFPSKEINGIASPINRKDPGFIGGGKTAGGAHEFVIPNGPVPNNFQTSIIKENGK